MTLNISVSQNDILEKNIENVRKAMEPIIEDPEMTRVYENELSFNFLDQDMLDLVKRLHLPEYKEWFRILDQEFPAMPYFLSTKMGNSLLLFLMGVLDYKDVGSNIVFETVSSGRFFRKKVHEIKNICLSNNINPQASVERLSALLNEREDTPSSKDADFENEIEKSAFPVVTQTDDGSKEESRIQESATADTTKEKGGKIQKLLERYGSIAVATGSGNIKLMLLFEETPKDGMRLKGNTFLYNNKKKFGYFITSFETAGGDLDLRSILLYDTESAVSAISKNGGVKIEGMVKNSEGRFVKVFEFGSLVPVSFPEEVDNVEKNGNTLAEEDEVNRISELEKENEKLKKEIENLQNLIELYEEDTKKRSGFMGFFRKFFK